MPKKELYFAEISWLIFLSVAVGLGMYYFGPESISWSFVLAFILFCRLLPRQGNILADKIMKNGGDNTAAGNAQIWEEGRHLRHAAYFSDKEWRLSAVVLAVICALFVLDFWFVFTSYETEAGKWWLNKTDELVYLFYDHDEGTYSSLYLLAAKHCMVSIWGASLAIFILIFTSISHKLFFAPYFFPLSLLPEIVLDTDDVDFPKAVSVIFQYEHDDKFWQAFENLQSIDRKKVSRLIYYAWFAIALAGITSVFLYHLLWDHLDLLYFFEYESFQGIRTLTLIILLPWLGGAFSYACIHYLCLARGCKAILGRLSKILRAREAEGVGGSRIA